MNESTAQAGQGGAQQPAIEILVVEDSLTQAIRLRHTLQHHGYKIELARDGQEALNAIRQRPAQIVISDVEMPVMDGYEMCRHLKSDETLRHIPVILLTSLSAPRDVIKGLDCGAESFMVKPYDEQLLLSRIRYLLGAGQSLNGSSNGHISEDSGDGIEVFLAGETHLLHAKPSLQTAVGLLLGTYETTLQKNIELSQAKVELEQQARELARSNAELETVSRTLRLKNERMQADLNLAREIQSSFIPRQYPGFPGGSLPFDSALRFCHRWIPTTTLGGDFFDVLALSDKQAGVFICDVMGHGVRSALITAMMRAMVGERTASASNPGQFMRELNQHLIHILQDSSTPLFASAFYMVIDTTNGDLSYTNAGHPFPLWMNRAAGTVKALPLDNDTGPVLGVFEEAEYTTLHCNLKEGDAIVLFTDGLFEVEGATGEFGEEGLRDAIRRRMRLALPPLFDGVLADVQKFSGKADFEDDVCLVGMEVAHIGN